MERISGKISGKIVAAVLAVVMLFGIVIGTGTLVERPFADEIGKFDPVFYAQAYPDVAAVLGTDAEVLYNHYQSFGQIEGRIPYAGAAAGETVEGIAGTDAAAQAAVQAPVTVTPRVLYGLDGMPVSAAEQLRKQQAFDAAGYVKVGWTEDQVQAKLLSLKEVYPEGTKIGVCSIGAGKIRNELYGDVVGSLLGVDEDDHWVYPEGHVGFVNRLINKNKGEVNLRDTMRVGDQIEFKPEHAAIVLSRDSEGITVVESNRNNDRAVHWGRRISWAELDDRCAILIHYLY